MGDTGDTPFREAVKETYLRCSKLRRYQGGLSAWDIRKELEGFELCTVIDVADEMEALFGKARRSW